MASWYLLRMVWMLISILKLRTCILMWMKYIYMLLYVTCLCRCGLRHQQCPEERCQSAIRHFRVGRSSVQAIASNGPMYT